MYFIQGVPPAKVECRFEESVEHVIVKTVVHHSQEEMIYTSLFEMYKDLIYSASKEQISNLKDTSKCSQALRMRCHYISHKTFVAWKSENGQWFKTEESLENCSCPFVNKCEEGKIK
jgi:hypothetical protein